MAMYKTMTSAMMLILMLLMMMVVMMLLLMLMMLLLLLFWKKRSCNHSAKCNSFWRALRSGYHAMLLQFAYLHVHNKVLSKTGIQKEFRLISRTLYRW